MRAKRPGNVTPFHCSNGKSAAIARYSVTSGVVRFVIFSTPPTMTTSYIPESIAMIPYLIAAADEAQAVSILIAGAGNSPVQSERVGAMCP